jgi:hypothetical protein
MILWSPVTTLLLVMSLAGLAHFLFLHCIQTPYARARPAWAVAAPVAGIVFSATPPSQSSGGLRLFTSLRLLVDRTLARSSPMGGRVEVHNRKNRERASGAKHQRAADPKMQVQEPGDHGRDPPSRERKDNTNNLELLVGRIWNNQDEEKNSRNKNNPKYKC